MTVINLSERYVKQGNPSVIDRARIAFSLDFYYASSISEAREYFNENPPKKRARLARCRSAYVSIHNAQIRRLKDSFDEEDGVSLDGLNDGLCFPYFELKDETASELVVWMAGNSERYMEALEEFGINFQTFAEVDTILLQYRDLGETDFFAIRNLQTSRRLKKESLAERVSKFVEELSRIPKPAILE